MNYRQNAGEGRCDTRRRGDCISSDCTYFDEKAQSRALAHKAPTRGAEVAPASGGDRRSIPGSVRRDARRRDVARRRRQCSWSHLARALARAPRCLASSRTARARLALGSRRPSAVRSSCRRSPPSRSRRVPRASSPARRASSSARSARPDAERVARPTPSSASVGLGARRTIRSAHASRGPRGDALVVAARKGLLADTLDGEDGAKKKKKDKKKANNQPGGARVDSMAGSLEPAFASKKRPASSDKNWIPTSRT